MIWKERPLPHAKWARVLLFTILFNTTEEYLTPLGLQVVVQVF